MLANHRLEVGLEKLAEEISALRNERRRKYDAKCVVIFIYAKMSGNYQWKC